jgi:hypothetical protein
MRVLIISLILAVFGVMAILFVADMIVPRF